MMPLVVGGFATALRSLSVEFQVVNGCEIPCLVDPQYGILSTKGQPNYSTCNLRMYMENTISLQIDYSRQYDYFLGLLGVFL